MRKACSCRRSRLRGFSLVELMIAMVLGLLVVGAAGSLFFANRKIYGSTETVNRIQENARAAFEIMSRDLREAGGNPCLAAPDAPLVNMLVSRDGAWWKSYKDGLAGTEGGAAPDTVMTHLANGGDYRVVRHATPGATLDVDRVDGLVDGGIYLVCNPDIGLVFKATALSSDGKIQHNDGGGSDPGGNCGQQFQWKDPDSCSGASSTFGYCFMVPEGTPASSQCDRTSDSPAVVVRVYAARWTVEDNRRGGRSLYRTVIVNPAVDGVAAQERRSEIAEGVTDMQVSYKIGQDPGYVRADAVGTQWKAVTAARVALTLRGAEGGALRRSDVRGTDDEVLTRQLVNVVAIRNRRGIL